MAGSVDAEGSGVGNPKISWHADRPRISNLSCDLWAEGSPLRMQPQLNTVLRKGHTPHASYLEGLSCHGRLGLGLPVRPPLVLLRSRMHACEREACR